MNKNFDIQLIEQVLADAVIAGGVSRKVFRGNRPNVKEVSMNDFVVVSVVAQVADMGAIGRSTCRIELFAKNLSNGEKNSTKLSIMYSKLLGIFPLTHETYIFNNHPVTIPLGTDNYGFNVIAIQFQTHIKTL